MFCISIGEYGLDACRKALKRCGKYRKEFPDLLAEIRLDLCGLTEKEVGELFMNSDIPLIATCMKRSSHLYETAMLSGAAYVDVNIFSYANIVKENKVAFKNSRTKLILSFHDYSTTPSLPALANIYKEAVELGADMVKIVTTAEKTSQAVSVLNLYRMLREGKLGKKVPLIAFAMGEAGRFSRIEAVRLGAPHIYCALKQKNIVAPGMFVIDEAIGILQHAEIKGEIKAPASKSIAQRVIMAAMLAKGESEFHNFTHCGDIDAAVGVAKQFANDVYIDHDSLIIRGTSLDKKKDVANPYSDLLSMSMQGMGVGSTKTAFVGESGLLSRLCIPVVAQFGESVTITGEGSLLNRHMYGCKEAMEELGASCLLTAEETLPAVVCGPIKGGEITVSGKKGSQFISGLLMALPLSKKDSILTVEHPTSIPYIMLTLEAIRKFGITVEYRQEGDNMVFEIPGKQKYTGTELTIEGDWSAVANFAVMAAVFGEITILGVNRDSLQGDKRILDIVRGSGAVVEDVKDGIKVSKGLLKPFNVDITNTPDLMPILSVMAAFAEGTSTFTGISRLKNKESNRPLVMYEQLTKLGVQISIHEDTLEVSGISYTRRIVEGKLLKGASLNTFSDHRIAMALKVASLGASGKVVLDSTDCIDKSFPGFLKIFNKLITP